MRCFSRVGQAVSLRENGVNSLQYNLKGENRIEDGCIYGKTTLNVF